MPGTHNSSRIPVTSFDSVLKLMLSILERTGTFSDAIFYLYHARKHQFGFSQYLSQRNNLRFDVVKCNIVYLYTFLFLIIYTAYKESVMSIENTVVYYDRYYRYCRIHSSICYTQRKTHLLLWK